MVKLCDRYPSVANLHETDCENPLRRAYSADQLDQNPESFPEQSKLCLSTNRVNLGEKLIVSWYLVSAPQSTDRLALYYDGEESLSDFIDAKSKHIGKSKIGHFTWHISKDFKFREVINVCVFKYLRAGLNTCVAKSPVFTICCPLSSLNAEMTPPMAIPGVDDLLVIKVSGIKASNLKKSFFGKPNPAVKINVVPRVRHLAAFQKHHGQQLKTDPQANTTDPRWEDKNYEISATAADLLEIEVRNKSKARPAASKFLGKLVFPLSKIIETCGLNVSRRITQHLIGRTTADKVQGTFSFTINLKKSSQKAEYRFPRMCKRISASGVIDDSTPPLPSTSQESIVVNGTKQRPHSFHPLFNERTSSRHSSSNNRNTAAGQARTERETVFDSNVRPDSQTASSPSSSRHRSASDPEHDYAELEVESEDVKRVRQYRRSQSMTCSTKSSSKQMSVVAGVIKSNHELGNCSEVLAESTILSENRNCSADSLSSQLPSTTNSSSLPSVQHSASVIERVVNSIEMRESSSDEADDHSSIGDNVPDVQDDGVLGDNEESDDNLETRSKSRPVSTCDVVTEDRRITEEEVCAENVEQSNVVGGSVQETEEDEEGYFEVEHEFTNDELESFESSEADGEEHEHSSAEESNTTNLSTQDNMLSVSSHELFRVNSCQRLLQDDCEDNNEVAESQTSQTDLPLEIVQISQDGQEGEAISLAAQQSSNLLDAPIPENIRTSSISQRKTDDRDKNSLNLYELVNINYSQFKDSPNLNKPKEHITRISIEDLNTMIDEGPNKSAESANSMDSTAQSVEGNSAELGNKVDETTSTISPAPPVESELSNGAGLIEGSDNDVDSRMTADDINIQLSATSTDGNTIPTDLQDKPQQLCGNDVATNNQSDTLLQLSCSPEPNESDSLLQLSCSPETEHENETRNDANNNSELDIVTTSNKSSTIRSAPKSQAPERIDLFSSEDVGSLDVYENVPNPNLESLLHSPNVNYERGGARPRDRVKQQIKSSSGVDPGVDPPVKVSLENTLRSEEDSETSLLSGFETSQSSQTNATKFPSETGLIQDVLFKTNSSSDMVSLSSIENIKSEKSSSREGAATSIDVSVTKRQPEDNLILNGVDRASNNLDMTDNNGDSTNSNRKNQRNLSGSRNKLNLSNIFDNDFPPFTTRQTAVGIPTVATSSVAVNKILNRTDQRISTPTTVTLSSSFVASVSATNSFVDPTTTSVTQKHNTAVPTVSVQASPTLSFQASPTVSVQANSTVSVQPSSIPSSSAVVTARPKEGRRSLRGRKGNRARLERPDTAVPLEVSTSRQTSDLPTTQQSVEPNNVRLGDTGTTPPPLPPRNVQPPIPPRAARRVQETSELASNEGNKTALTGGARSKLPRSNQISGNIGTGSPGTENRVRSRARNGEAISTSNQTHVVTTSREQPIAGESSTVTGQNNNQSHGRPRQTPKAMNRITGGAPKTSSSNDDRLPRNWEKAVDSHGRTYYIDHTNKTTTWHRPRMDAPTSPEHNVNAQLEQLDRRYQSLRRTIRAGKRTGELPEGSNPEANSVPQQSTNTNEAAKTRQAANGSSTSLSSLGSSSGNINRQGSERSRERSVTEAPGCLFIRRRDLFQFINNHTLAAQFLHRNPTLKQIINRVRAEPSKFDRYQHSRDVVTLLNFFANDALPVPPGWEVKSDQYGQNYFVDHTRRATTFIDPRLPFQESTRVRPPHERPTPSPSTSTDSSRPRSSPSPSVQESTTSAKEEPVVPKTYDEKVVAFLRQDGVSNILRQRESEYTNKTSLQRKISFIQRDGVNGLKRLQNDMELVILLSMFEEEIQTYLPKSALQHSLSRDSSLRASIASGRTPAPYRRDFEAKIRTFHKQLVQSSYGQGPGKIRLKIRRTHVLQDAFEQIMKQSPRGLHKEKLYIKFTGEEGLDYGGPAREFFFMISRELFNPYYGLFEYSASDTYTLQVSPASRYADNANNWFRFVGRIIALALVHQHLLDVFFTRTIYKALLREPWDLSDVETIDPEYHRGLVWMLENDITDVLDNVFTVDEEVFGHEQVYERELKPNGKNIPVTEANKREYVDLVVKWKIERGMGEQMEQIIKGFSECLDLSMISLFDDRELELVIAGTADIDVKDWRKNTEYRSGYHDKHNVVQWFWQAVDSFTNERRLRLIQFVTGTSSIPYEGFGALRGSTGLKKFTIDCWGTDDMLPRAHTCFNRLDLPPYKDYKTLVEKVMFAIEETSTFGIE